MFYTYYQNNSGGYIYDDENVGQNVVIEGNDLEEIRSKAREVFRNYHKYCPCCGERWEDLDYEDECNLEEFPSILNNSDSFWEGSSIIVYFKDERKVKYIHK